MLPRRYLPAAVIAAVGSYLAWIAAAAGDYDGKVVLTALTASVFWLSVMALVAYAVQAGVRRRQRGGPGERDRR